MAVAANEGLASSVRSSRTAWRGSPQCRCRPRSARLPCCATPRPRAASAWRSAPGSRGRRLDEARSSRSGLQRPSSICPVTLHPGLHGRGRSGAGAVLSRERARLSVRHHDRDRAADLRRRTRPASGTQNRPGPCRRVLPVSGGSATPCADGATRALRLPGGAPPLSRSPLLRHHHPRSARAGIPRPAGRPRPGRDGHRPAVRHGAAGAHEPPAGRGRRGGGTLAIAETNPSALYGLA